MITKSYLVTATPLEDIHSLFVQKGKLRKNKHALKIMHQNAKALRRKRRRIFGRS